MLINKNLIELPLTQNTCDGSQKCKEITIPGENTQRACAFHGSRISICSQIDGVIHLVHSPVGCALYSWVYRSNKNENCITTNIQENDVIFGSEEKLFNAIIEAHNEFPDMDAIFVYETCVPGLIGEDMRAITDKASKIIKKPVLLFNSAGFKGISQNEGHKVASDELFSLIGTGTNSNYKKEKHNLNLIGEYNPKDFESAKEMLNLIGVNVVASFTANSTIDAIKSLHETDLNIVECSKSTMNLAKHMEYEFKVPFMEAKFFGIDNCSSSIVKIGNFFGIEEEKQEFVIEQCMNEIAPELEIYKKRLANKTAFISYGAQRIKYLIGPLTDLGIRVIGVSSYFGGKKDHKGIKKQLERNRRLTGSNIDYSVVISDNPDTQELKDKIIEHKPDLFISDNRLRFFAYRLKIPFVYGKGTEKSYAGFKGFLNFARELDSVINSKIWRF
ncbi:MAG: nitrogenase [Methanosarcinales archaeon]|jgi:nitrogenase molybdenum-iron protein alpha/beta subunit|nr:nitrogenase [Methanosarcinales archaeon]